MVLIISEVNEQQFFREVNRHIEIKLVRLTDTSDFVKVSLMNSSFFVRLTHTLSVIGEVNRY